MAAKKELSSEVKEELIETLKTRFQENMHRHKGYDWDKIQSKLEADPDKLWSLNEMEVTGGEPDIIDIADTPGIYTFVDCSPESPKGRRSLCYDREALESRKKYPPKSSVIDVTNEMGIELLNEEQYYKLQSYGEFDTKTSSWIKTPAEVRELGGALFCDRRYNQVFTYHNGADSYYAARGFRGVLRVKNL
ncbi:MAG: DUF4256 domain-containing protein [Balneola sp.]